MAVLHHQDRFDGAGSTDRLSGEKIPVLARILGVAVIFDALTSDRPYRAAHQTLQAYDILRDSAGYQLDPDLVERFVKAHQGQAAASM